jgi:hypothetical protein
VVSEQFQNSLSRRIHREDCLSRKEWSETGTIDCFEFRKCQLRCSTDDRDRKIKVDLVRDCARSLALIKHTSAHPMKLVGCPFRTSICQRHRNCGYTYKAYFLSFSKPAFQIMSALRNKLHAPTMVATILQNALTVTGLFGRSSLQLLIQEAQSSGNVNQRGSPGNVLAQQP